MTIEQLRAANDAGGVVGVTLKGQGGAFLVQIATRSGSAALLAKARSQEPRRFGNPIAALNVLRDVGITIGRFDASEWNPDEKEESAGCLPGAPRKAIFGRGQKGHYQQTAGAD